MIEIMGKELGWNAAKQEEEFDRTIYFLRSMGLQEAKAQIKLKDVPRSTTTLSPARLPTPEEAALYNQALFTPAEVAQLQKRFRDLDFVSARSLSVLS